MIWPFRRRGEKQRAVESSDVFDTWGRLPFFGARTGSGVVVNSESPLSHETVLSCYNVIAEGCAMLPAYLYRERGASRQHATDHPLYDLLLTSPCPHMTAFGWWKLVFFEKLHYGNHYSLIVRDAAGFPRALEPIENGRCQPFWYKDPDTGRWARAYRVSMPDLPQAIFLESEIFHVQNLPVLRGANYGLLGVSVWQMYLSETMGTALATNEFASRNFANGASLSGMVSVKERLDPEAARAARAMVQEAYGGADNAGKIGVFGSGATFTAISQDNQKAQLLETRKFNRSIIAGVLRVTAHLINDLEHGTFSNVEHLDLAHYKHCLRPHLVDATQVIAKDVLTPEERRTLYVDHDETEFLRGDARTRAEVLEKAIQNARMTPNEARAEENRPPMPGGDELYINSASVPLRLAAEGPQKPVAGSDPASNPPA